MKKSSFKIRGGWKSKKFDIFAHFQLKSQEMWSLCHPRSSQHSKIPNIPPQFRSFLNSKTVIISSSTFMSEFKSSDDTVVYVQLRVQDLNDIFTYIHFSCSFCSNGKPSCFMLRSNIMIIRVSHITNWKMVRSLMVSTLFDAFSSHLYSEEASHATIRPAFNTWITAFLMSIITQLCH